MRAVVHPFVVVLAAVLVTAVPTVTRATPICVDVGGQQTVRLVSDGSGGVLLTWIDDRHGYDPGLRVQHMLSTGAVDPAWPLNGRAVSAPRTQITPFIVSDGAHGAIVGWTDYFTSRVYVQRVRANGTLDPVWPANGVALSSVSATQTLRDLVSDGSGGAIAVWDDNRVEPWRVYAQHVTGSGAIAPSWPATGRAVSPGLGYESQPRAVSDGAHGAVIVWTRDVSDVYAQHLLVNGTLDPAWPAGGRALRTGSLAFFPVAVEDGTGGAIVAWRDDGTGESHVYAQHVTGAGAIASGWPATAFPVCTASGTQDFPAISTDGSGGAIVAWEDHRTGAADIYALRLLAGGGIAPGWTADGRPVCTSTNDQLYPDIASDGAGGAIVTWQDASNNLNYDIYARRVEADGTLDPAWPPPGRDVCAFPDAQYNPQILADGAGGAIVAWQDLRNGTDWDIYAQRLLSNGAFGGTVGVEPAARGGLALAPALENPTARGRLVVRFTLPNDAPAMLELMDVGGRRLAVREVGALGAGVHEVGLAPQGTVRPGIYLVRLRQGGGQRLAKICLLESAR